VVPRPSVCVCCRTRAIGRCRRYAAAMLTRHAGPQSELSRWRTGETDRLNPTA
jgi:hypothetical protein